ncbi:MAG TPA: hypothetical protein VN632_09475 [Stellaceae bacterium]|nr:hypothetical protein [Stellaceae bacterium]
MIDIGRVEKSPVELGVLIAQFADPARADLGLPKHGRDLVAVVFGAVDFPCFVRVEDRKHVFDLFFREGASLVRPRRQAGETGHPKDDTTRKQTNAAHHRTRRLKIAANLTTGPADERKA